MEIGLERIPDGRFENAVVQFVVGTGRAVAWLTLLTVIVTFAIVILRYGLNLGWIWLQEAVTYMHAAVFMLAAAWALQADEHVRVDIFYRGKPPRHKAWVNLLGTVLFVVPFSVFLFWIAWNYVAASWGVMEGSREAGGLDYVYLLKSLILVLPVMLLLQSLVSVMQNLRVLRSGNGA